MKLASGWHRRTCGRFWEAHTAEYQRQVLHRCRKGHYELQDLQLLERPATLNNCIFIIAMPLNATVAHNADEKLKQPLIDAGASSEPVDMVYGIMCGTKLAGGF